MKSFEKVRGPIDTGSILRAVVMARSGSHKEIENWRFGRKDIVS
jgi:hypothetical protein